MKGKRFTEEQTGNIREACKRNNITENTFYP